METVRMRLRWDLDVQGKLTSHWVKDPTYRPPVDLASHRKHAEGALERAASYVRQAPTAG